MNGKSIHKWTSSSKTVKLGIIGQVIHKRTSCRAMHGCTSWAKIDKSCMNGKVAQKWTIPSQMQELCTHVRMDKLCTDGQVVLELTKLAWMFLSFRKNVLRVVQKWTNHAHMDKFHASARNVNKWTSYAQADGLIVHERTNCAQINEFRPNQQVVHNWQLDKLWTRGWVVQKWTCSARMVKLCTNCQVVHEWEKNTQMG
jgi:hypothetical protein